MILPRRSLIDDWRGVESILVLIIVWIVFCYLLGSPEDWLLNHWLGFRLSFESRILQALIVLLLSSHERRHVLDEIK
jgi:hypothetical protein